MIVEKILCWMPEQGKLMELPADEPDVLLAADSWLVADGMVRGLDLHRERFFSACEGAADIASETLDSFWSDAVAALPRDGYWFPRVELVDVNKTFKLKLRIRRAPPLTREVALMRWPEADPRAQPRRKGPDIALLSRMRQQAIAAGADEAILTMSDGIVLEGLTTSLFWWEGDVLCLPDDGLPVLPGVTSRLVLQLAQADGLRAMYKRQPIEALDGMTVWTVNALHGIRPAVRWINSSWTASAHVDHTQWQTRLLHLAVHLDAK